MNLRQACKSILQKMRHKALRDDLMGAPFGRFLAAQINFNNYWFSKEAKAHREKLEQDGYYENLIEVCKEKVCPDCKTSNWAKTMCNKQIVELQCADCHRWGYVDPDYAETDAAWKKTYGCSI